MSNKLHNKIEELIINAISNKNGKDSFYSYKTLVDEILSNDQYHIYTSVLLSKWNIDSKKFANIQTLVKVSYDIIVKLLPSSEQKIIKELFDSYNLYQNGVEIYQNDTSNILGELVEYNISTYYELYNDNGFLEKTKNLVRCIQVKKGDTILEINDSDTNIYEKYDNALQYLMQN